MERLDSPERIGAPPAALNQLVDYDPDRDDSPLLYFTAGGPYFETIRNCGFAVELRPERDAALKVKQHADTKISAASASTGATAPARAEQETG
ncbi:MAG: hypothetical protein KJO38_05930 [Gammaproteobacteria bacterium]|nr:hypothetical protein [Gammaproteobacteria bacterium]